MGLQIIAPDKVVRLGQVKLGQVRFGLVRLFRQSTKSNSFSLFELKSRSQLKPSQNSRQVNEPRFDSNPINSVKCFPCSMAQEINFWLFSSQWSATPTVPGITNLFAAPTASRTTTSACSRPPPATRKPESSKLLKENANRVRFPFFLRKLGSV